MPRKKNVTPYQAAARDARQAGRREPEAQSVPKPVSPTRSRPYSPVFMSPSPPPYHELLRHNLESRVQPDPPLPPGINTHDPKRQGLPAAIEASPVPLPTDDDDAESIPAPSMNTHNPEHGNVSLSPNDDNSEPAPAPSMETYHPERGSILLPPDDDLDLPLAPSVETHHSERGSVSLPPGDDVKLPLAPSMDTDNPEREFHYDEISAALDHDNLPENEYVLTSEEKSRISDIWRKYGYFDHHPNQVPMDAEMEARQRLEHKLGPILQEYKLFVNSNTNMRTLLIQYPTADHLYCDENGNKPIELRIKPKCGLVEVDIPLNIHAGFDKEKGIQYGEALRKSRVLQQGGSYGLAGGMGIGSQPTKDDRVANQPEGPSMEKMLENFDDANNKGHVMNKITLGGKIEPFKEGDPIYMVATFKDDICTWTPLDAMVQVRAQFSHLDALHEQEKAGTRTDRAREDEDSDKEGGKEAKAVNMAVKQTDDKDESNMYGGMNETAKLLKAMRDEPWQRLQWVDSEDEESYRVYDENLVYQDPGNAPQLISQMSNKQYLDAVSCPRMDPVEQGKMIMAGKDSSAARLESVDDEESEDDEADEDDKDAGKDEAEEEDDDDDGDEDGDEESSYDSSDYDEEDGLPTGVSLPEDEEARVFIEMVCRLICSYPPDHQATAVPRMGQRLRGDPDYSFLKPRDPDYPYFDWRLLENKAGRGYPPEEDLPRLREA